MRVGLTYDLRDTYLAEGYSAEETAEFDSIVTIDGLNSALCRRGYKVERIGNVRQLAARLVAGDRWDLVFNIAEGLRGVGREAQVPALLDAYGVPYTFSDPLVMALTLDKAMTKRVIRDSGLPTADFAVVAHPAAAAGVDLPFPLFVKPVAEGTGKGITAASKVDTPEALTTACTEVIARFQQPALVETYLPGREFTVGIVGTGKDARAIGLMEVLFGEKAEANGYTFENKERYEDRVLYRMPDDAAARAAADVALAAWRTLGCRDGGRLDLRCDSAGQPNFIEANPLAGLHPVRSDLVILAKMFDWTYDDLIGAIVESCLQRLGPAARAAAA